MDATVPRVISVRGWFRLQRAALWASDYRLAAVLDQLPSRPAACLTVEDYVEELRWAMIKEQFRFPGWRDA